MQMKHMQHPDETAEIFENILAIYVYSHYNICLKQLKHENIHSQHTFIIIATYATLDLFLQRPDETYATYI
jgi:hypothetical protein